MTSEIKQEIIKLPYYQYLSNIQKDALLRNSYLKEYQKGASIYSKSDECLGMILVLKGSIRVYIISEEGREVTLFHIKENDYCILSASCALGELMIEPNFVVQEDTQIISVSSSYFQKLLKENIYVECFSYKLASKRLQTILWVMQEIVFKRADQRVARFLFEQYQKTKEDTIKMSQEKMASEINTAREVVTRMLKSFAKEGIIEIERSTIKIVDVDKLRQLL